MPTKAFYRLGDEKKEIILNAATEEFKKYTYDHISINRIIQSIGLPRGSFYLYFKDKEDLYLYVISKYHNIILSTIISIARENNDIVKTYKELFERAISFCSDERLLKSFLLGLNHNIENKVMYNMIESLALELVVSVKSDISLDVLKDALSLLSGALIHSLTTYYILNLDLDIVRKRYYNQVDIIGKGIIIIIKEDLCLNYSKI